MGTVSRPGQLAGPSRHWRVDTMTIGDNDGGKTSLCLPPTRRSLTGKGGSSVDWGAVLCSPSPGGAGREPAFLLPLVCRSTPHKGRLTPHPPESGGCRSLDPGSPGLQSHDLLGPGQMTHFSSFPRIGILPASPIRGRLRPRVDYLGHQKDQEAFVSEGELCTRGWAPLPARVSLPHP